MGGKYGMILKAETSRYLFSGEAWIPKLCEQAYLAQKLPEEIPL
jgi:hypothetical protein